MPARIDTILTPVQEFCSLVVSLSTIPVFISIVTHVHPPGSICMSHSEEPGAVFGPRMNRRYMTSQSQSL